MKRITYWISFILLIELIARLSFLILWDIPLFKKENIIYRYYPSLKGVQEIYLQDTSQIKVLVLGGSAVTANLYCDLDFELKWQLRNNQFNERAISVYNLAEIAHTSFDSRFKREFLSGLKFDYTFIYDGFNDCRANNIPSHYFQEDYSHFTYYKEVLLYQKYIPKHISILPYTFHFIQYALRKKLLPQPHVPEHYDPWDISNVEKNTLYWEEGKNIKSLKSFKKNLDEIYTTNQNISGQHLILSTYANYTPENYSLQKFNQKELDYREQRWPAEIYGDPIHMDACVNAHNSMIQSWKDSNHVSVLDLDSRIPKNKNYYHDICHITDRGCQLMAEEILRVIYPQLVKDES